MSTCLSGGGRAIRLDLEIIKSPSSSWISNSLSPSSTSTLTESSNSPIAISTRKPRTPRKRPNQLYNEAAAILSAAYPKIFPTKHLTKPYKFTKPHNNYDNPFPYEPSELFIPFRVVETSAFLLHPPILETPNFPSEPKGIGGFDQPCQSPGEINSKGCSLDSFDDNQEDFNPGLILDEEVDEEGIDSIMGKLSKDDSFDDLNNSRGKQMSSWCYGYPIGLGFGGSFGFGMRKEVKALKKADDGNWWRFPSVNVQVITPKTSKIQADKKKKVEKAVEVDTKNPLLVKLKSSSTKANKMNSSCKSAKEEVALPKPNAGLSLKLNYDEVMNAWSDKGSPFSGETPLRLEATTNDVQARLAQIDLFGEDAEREASALRSTAEKRRTRLSSKKIRCQVRKLNLDQQPKLKGRRLRSPPREGERKS